MMFINNLKIKSYKIKKPFCSCNFGTCAANFTLTNMTENTKIVSEYFQQLQKTV